MMDPMQRAPAVRGRGSRSRQVGAERQHDDTAPSLFDPPPDDAGLEQGRRLRDDGRRTAELATWSPWRRKADRWIEERAGQPGDFDADDLIQAVGPPVASSKNATGPVFASAARRGLIVKTGEYRQSRRASRRASVIAVWTGTGPASG